MAPLRKKMGHALRHVEHFSQVQILRGSDMACLPCEQKRAGKQH
jgi:hypothetical protein